MRTCRLLAIVVMSALAVAGCAQDPARTATTQRGPDLDSLAYNTGPCEAGGCKRNDLPPRIANAYASPPEEVAHAFTPVAYAQDEPYRLDAGDKLRIVVYGQEGLTNTYTVDAGGAITMPLIGAVKARGLTPAELAASVTSRLKKGYIREPYVAAEIESYRPFFILGEVTAPGQYPYVPNMTVESAVAIAGGFTPRAQRDTVKLTRSSAQGAGSSDVPLGTALRPGDTVVIGERWF